MSTFTTSYRKAEKLVASKQNRENAIALIGKDSSGNESFLQWIKSTDKISELNIPEGTKSLRALAGTLSCG